jgi:DNA polymerase
MPKSEGLDVRSVPPDLAAIKAAAAEKGVPVSNVTSGMLRHCVRLDGMMVADFAAVEPRMLSWLADDQAALAVWRDPRKSMYLEMGRRVFGREIAKTDETEYFISKQLVIGCGYGMSGWKYGLHLKKFGREFDDCDGVVKAYRKAMPCVTQLWQMYGDAVLAAARGQDSEVGRVKFYRDDTTLVVVKPSGRPIYYRNVRIEQRVPVYKIIYNMPLTPEDTVVYDHPVFGPRELYGGKVCENVDQGSCADLLADVLVALERGGYEPFMHAHDEVAAQRGDFEGFMRTCSTAPPWACGFPMAAEGYRGPLWAKCHDGWESAKYAGGERVV